MKRLLLSARAVAACSELSDSPACSLRCQRSARRQCCCTGAALLAEACRRPFNWFGVPASRLLTFCLRRAHSTIHNTHFCFTSGFHWLKTCICELHFGSSLLALSLLLHRFYALPAALLLGTAPHWLALLLVLLSALHQSTLTPLA